MNHIDQRDLDMLCDKVRSALNDLEIWISDHSDNQYQEGYQEGHEAAVQEGIGLEL